jgi:hypothetical protein
VSNEPKPQDTQDEPKQDVKPTDELAEEQLDDVNAGAVDMFMPNPNAQSLNFTNPAPQVPSVSPKIDVYKKAK